MKIVPTTLAAACAILASSCNSTSSTRPAVSTPVTVAQPRPTPVRPVVTAKPMMVTPAPVPTAPPKPMLATYTPKSAVNGRLRSIGSDTMDKLMLEWEAAFRKSQPQLVFIHEGKGSSTAVPALIEGQADFGPMSRAIKDSEIEAFKAKYGYAPLQLRVAIDALAVYVHPDNPILKQGLDFVQLDAIFSSSRKLGGADIVTWGQLGLTGEWADAPVRVYSRNKASGTYGFFKEHVLEKGEYRTTNAELVGSAEVISSVSQDRFGVGYSGVGYKTNAVATVNLSKQPSGHKFPAEAAPTYSGEYPLARYLYLAINLKPGAAPSDLQREFLRFVYSAEGQKTVKDLGFFPLSPEICTEESARLGF